jgi:hypothetical protein
MTRTTFVAGAALALLTIPCLTRAEPARFETPEAAVAALGDALEAGDRAAVLAMFGAENEGILSTGDPEEDRTLWGGFLDDMQTRTLIEVKDDDRANILVGRDLWPFPADILRGEDGWSFDAESAREEVLMRRIGRNELDVIEIMRRAPEVQAAYRRTDHDGDGVMEFAASILSSPDARDGLYWPESVGGEPSPFEETIARASFSGYSLDGADVDPEPFEGYYFRILQGQGAAAPGGPYGYRIAGNMVAGHALVAYPAVYGDTGIMSFMVGENGIVYEADLGEDTLQAALAIDVLDPLDPWSPVE